MKTYSGYTAIKTGAGRPVYVRDHCAEMYKKIFKEHKGNYHFTSIMRTILLLNANGGSTSGLNPAGDSRIITSGNVSMKYDVFDGAVFVQKLAISKSKEKKQLGFVLKLKLNLSSIDTEWLPERDKALEVDSSKQWQSNTGKAHYAAVAGRFSDIYEAAARMPEHLEGGFKKANMLTEGGRGNAYSLFWCEKGQHKSDEASQSLASIMQQSTQNKVPVNWLIHGDGIHAFTKAAKTLKAAPLASAAAINKNADAGKVQNQHVYFSNPSTSISKNDLQKICSDANIGFAGYNDNNHDLRKWKTLKNVGSEMGKQLANASVAGGAVGLAAMSGSLGAGSLEKAISGVVSGLASGNAVVIGVSVAAVGYSAVAVTKKSKTLIAGVNCTFGKGNQRWYEDEASLV